MSAQPAAWPTCGAQHCITCGDDGDPMTVVGIDERRGLALCSDDLGARATVETALVEPVAPGDRLLVHAGTAIARLASRDIG
jgi:hydrogenase expression/formation protein HypC